MERDLLIATYVVATLVLGYDMAFTAATLALGRAISSDSSGRRYQDAITPPWSTRLGWVTYFLCAVVVGLIWWRSGWLWGLGSLLALPFAGRLWSTVFPKPTSPHYRKLIVHSLMNRYANYRRDGDQLRAQAATFMLERLGLPLESSDH